MKRMTPDARGAILQPPEDRMSVVCSRATRNPRAINGRSLGRFLCHMSIYRFNDAARAWWHTWKLGPGRRKPVNSKRGRWCSMGSSWGVTRLRTFAPRAQCRTCGEKRVSSVWPTQHWKTTVMPRSSRNAGCSSKQLLYAGFA